MDRGGCWTALFYSVMVMDVGGEGGCLERTCEEGSFFFLFFIVFFCFSKRATDKKIVEKPYI